MIRVAEDVSSSRVMAIHDRWADVREKLLGPAAWAVGLSLMLAYMIKLNVVNALVEANLWGIARPRTIVDHRTLLWVVFKHWMPIAAIGVVIAIVAGRLGGGLGLPGLFRNPPDFDPAEERSRRKDPDYLHSRGSWTTFLGALGATLLICEVWTVIFFLEVVDNLPETGGTQVRHRAVPGPLRPAPVPLPDLLAVPRAAPAGRAVPEPRAGIESRGRDFLKEACYFLLGIAFGVALIVVATRIGAKLHDSLDICWAWARSHLGARSIGPGPASSALPWGGSTRTSDPCSRSTRCTPSPPRTGSPGSSSRG